jgi:uncharacterized DUF497 family protein
VNWHLFPKVLYTIGVVEGLGEFEWDDRNLRHFEENYEERHISPEIVRQVAERAPKLFPNQPGEGRSGSHLMVGPDREDRLCTVILLELGGERWRPITGWPSTNTEVSAYHQS